MFDVMSMLACPRCRGSVTERAETLDCEACQLTFRTSKGIPRMTDGAEQRDARMAAEWQAQGFARPQYTDRASVLNSWEVQVLPQLVDWLGEVHGPILDVGCGVGHLGTSLTAMGRSDLQLIGTDFQPDLLEEALPGPASVLRDRSQLTRREQGAANLR